MEDTAKTRSTTLVPPPHGEGGLKYKIPNSVTTAHGVPPPHGEGGLKLLYHRNETAYGQSLPPTGRVD